MSVTREGLAKALCEWSGSRWDDQTDLQRHEWREDADRFRPHVEGWISEAIAADRAANRAFRHMAAVTSERIARAIDATDVPEYGHYARTDGHARGLA